MKGSRVVIEARSAPPSGDRVMRCEGVVTKAYSFGIKVDVDKVADYPRLKRREDEEREDDEDGQDDEECERSDELSPLESGCVTMFFPWCVLVSPIIFCPEGEEKDGGAGATTG